MLPLPLLVLAASSAAHAAALKKRSTTDPTALSGKTFDFIVVGGGTAGLAVAARLAEWTNITVAVIEAGSDGTQYEDQITIPGMSYINGLTGTDYDWQYKTTPQTNAGGSALSWPRGKGLGGSSAINGGFWCRGSSAEYDAWNTLQNGASGAEDWGWSTMQASIKKAETYTPMSDENAATFSVTHDADSHGTSGPIHSSYSSYQYSHLSTWIPTMVAMGLPHTLDPANGTNLGVTFVPSIINPANGSRSDSNFGYIAPYSGTNLVILTGYQVTKINWNSTTTGSAVAGGVSFAASAGGQTYNVTAAKEVIVSGGTIGSPQVLQLSGVGPKDLLTGLGLTSVVDLPGVGSNLQDHLSASLYMAATDNNTWAALKFDQGLWEQQLDVWRANGTGMWTYWNEATAYPAIGNLMGTDASGWVSGLNTDSALSTSVSASTMDSTVQAGVKAQYAILAEWAASATIGQVELIFNMFGSAAGQIGIQFCIQHAWARGYVHINSASAFDAPDINPNYLSVSYDADVMRSALKYVRKIISTAPMSTMIAGETLPGTSVSADADIDSYIAKNSGTEYHPTGTSSMLPLSLGGVVDTTLKVYGTTNVRVVDVSIAPMSLSAHTMATTYGIAERAADLIKAKYGAVIASSSSAGANPSSSGSTSSSNTNTNDEATTSTLSTGTKVAIGAGSAVAAVALIAILFLVRRRSNKNRQAASRAALNKEDWVAGGEDQFPMQPRAPFMTAADKRASMQSEGSVDTFVNPEQQHVKYGPGPGQYGYGHPEGAYVGMPPGTEGAYAGVQQNDQYEPAAYEPVGLVLEGYQHPQPYDPAHPQQQAYHYGSLHSNLTANDVTSLHPPVSPASSSTPGSPRHSPARYTDALP